MISTVASTRGLAGSLIAIQERWYALVRVLIDASALPPLRGGVSRYVDELIAHLPEVGVDTAVYLRSLRIVSLGMETVPA
jgi:hypothetical protein